MTPLQPTADHSFAPPVVDEVLRSPGEPLAPAERDFFESRFGFDFGQVRVHTGPSADRAARAVRARAFAVGGHLVFAGGEYGLGRRADQRLLAHELAHVVQQARAGGPAASAPLEICPPWSPYEAQAERVAEQVLAGGAPMWEPPDLPPGCRLLFRHYTGVLDADPVVILLSQGKYREMFRELNGRWMKMILWVLWEIRRRKSDLYSVLCNDALDDGTLGKAGIFTARMKAALLAVAAAGEYTPAEFEEECEDLLDQLPYDQQQEIFDFLWQVRLDHRPEAAVWASGPGIPIHSCGDARLLSRDGKSFLNSDASHGQAGWDIGISFKDSRDLTNKLLLATISSRPVVRKLAILAHGEFGEVHWNGTGNNPLTYDTWESQTGELMRIRAALTPDATLLFMSCSAGGGLKGTQLLTALSNYFHGRKVVGFSTRGYSSEKRQRRAGESCHYPGMRDTEHTSKATGEAEEYERYHKDGRWEDLAGLPWASESSRHAKVALNGVIIQYPACEMTDSHGVKLHQ